MNNGCRQCLEITTADDCFKPPVGGVVGREVIEKNSLLPAKSESVSKMQGPAPPATSEQAHSHGQPSSKIEGKSCSHDAADSKGKAAAQGEKHSIHHDHPLGQEGSPKPVCAADSQSTIVPGKRKESCTLAVPTSDMLDVNAAGSFTSHACLWDPAIRLWRTMDANIEGGIVLRPLRREDLNGRLQDVNQVGFILYCGGVMCLCETVYACVTASQSRACM